MGAWYKNAGHYALNLALRVAGSKILALFGQIEGSVYRAPDSGVAALHASV
jgi:hypothetical protein